MVLLRSGPLGAPGVYRTAPEPIRHITGVRRDIAAFFGVAPRGPARLPLVETLSDDADLADWLRRAEFQRSVPVRVSSWEEYRYHFGSFEGPGRLPYAVSAFFAQGGRDAYVVRIVARERDPRSLAGRASGLLGDLVSVGGDPIRIHARSEGSWGNRIRAELRFDPQPVALAELASEADRSLLLENAQVAPVGSLLRLETGQGRRYLRYVTHSHVEPLPGQAGVGHRVVLDRRLESTTTTVEVVASAFEIADLDPSGERAEIHADVGLHPLHRRFLPRMLIKESNLLWPGEAWVADSVAIENPDLDPVRLTMPAVSDRQTTVLPGVETEAGGAVVLRLREQPGPEDRIEVQVSFDVDPLEIRNADGGRLLIAGVGERSNVQDQSASDQNVSLEGQLIRLRTAGGDSHLQVIDELAQQRGPGGVGFRWALDLPPRLGVVVSAEVVTATIEILHCGAVKERHQGIGFGTRHSRFLADVIDAESSLLESTSDWRHKDLRPVDPCLPAIEVSVPDGHDKTRGRDLWHEVTPEDFVSAESMTPAERSGSGLQVLAGLPEVGIVVVPDLYQPEPTASEVSEPQAVTHECRGDFGAPAQTLPVDRVGTSFERGLEGLTLDARIREDRERIEAVQSRLVNLAEQEKSFTALLDVPLGLDRDAALRWREGFGSRYAAAYAPWIDVQSERGDGSALTSLGPSSLAAGIIAERELRFGVQYGPANQIAVRGVRQTSPVSPADHDVLHLVGINVFMPERDGLRLTSARTLSRLPEVRQLSVARLLTVIRLTLAREMEWAVFEPNNQALWASVRRMVTDFLQQMYRANAFAGAASREAFFVRCDRTTMTQNDIDNGRLVCLVGVAPVEPLEYVKLRISLSEQAGVEIV